MELKEFISKTVVDIIKGIENASEVLKKKKQKIGLYSTGKSNQRHIEFDVAVEVKGKGGKSGDLGIKVFEVGIGGKKYSEAINSTVSRVKFGVRISDIKKG